MKTYPVMPLHPLPSPAATSTGQDNGLRQPPPLALYVHFPWCVQKCPYCDFNSHAVREPLPEAAYLDALVADLTAALPRIWGRRVVSVFIGGGTPSLLSPAGLDRLLGQIRMLLPLDPLAEITLEANPGTVDCARFAGFRAAGVTRLSLGVQSFNDRLLAAIGRIHDGAAAREAAIAALTHFETVNLDLMYALPGQRPDEALADLDIALSLAPAHLSCYHLTVEPNTAFAAHPPVLPDDDAAADIESALHARLLEAGYRHYETSAFARPGRECVHNLNYWTFGDYLGIGAGAHGKLSSHEGIFRETRPRHPAAYLAAAARGDFVESRREVGPDDLPFEFMMNALRLNQGVARRLFAERTGLAEARLAAPLAQAQAAGLLWCDAERLGPTARGQRYLNDLVALFMAAV